MSILTRIAAPAAGLALVAAALPAASVWASDRMVIQSVNAIGTGWTHQIEVHVTGPGVRSLKTDIAALSLVDGQTVARLYATVDDFALVSGTVTDGIWRSATAVTFELGPGRLSAAGVSTEGQQVSRTASATQKAPGRFVDVAIDEEKIEGLQRKVTYQGRVVYTGPDGAERPAGTDFNSSGRVYLRVSEFQQWPVSLDQAGRFTGSVTLSYGGPASVSLVAPYLTVRRSDSIQLSPPSKSTAYLADAKISPKTVGKGAKVTGTARVVNSGAAYSPIAGMPVYLQFSTESNNGWTNVGQGTSDADGAVRVSAVASKDGYWRLSFPGYYDPDATMHYDDSSSVPTSVDVRYRTAVSSFNASPEPVSKGRPLTVTGVVKRSLDGSTWKTWSGQVVYVYFKARGATSWSYAGTVKSDAYGKFRRSFTASKDGTWKAVYKGNADYLRADSATDYVDVR